MSFLTLQNPCQSSGCLDLVAFLYNHFFLLHILFKSTEPGNVVSRSCKTDWYIVFHNVDDFC